ncbi:hypothetical protein B0J11DRAFT_601694 [Dendryphion nanum]|uniref:Uncharacterized protein n=1 Tax=Dendryphion nanum TaxID=256645 RepID=A0A9P9CYU2_9PLEO|nr:hypothetical protein B0J11DRAFT_601694 [Dendryphion nanum]
MQYTALPSKDQLEEHAHPASLKEKSNGVAIRCQAVSHCRVYLFGTLSLLFSTILCLSSLLLFLSQPSEEQCAIRWNMDTPLEAAVAADPPSIVRFDGRFWPESKFKGPPTPKRDEAWSELTNHGGGVYKISKETLIAINASEHTVQFPDGTYAAGFEIVHYLHCLSFLRQATYEDAYKNKASPWTDSEATVRVHLDHCIDILRQKLMCDSDTGLVTFVWVKGRRKPYPDFNVQKKCRDHSKIQSWIRAHYADVEKVEKLPGSYEFEEDI